MGAWELFATCVSNYMVYQELYLMQYELYQNWPNEDLRGNEGMIRFGEMTWFWGGTGVERGSIIGMHMYIFNEYIVFKNLTFNFFMHSGIKLQYCHLFLSFKDLGRK